MVNLFTAGLIYVVAACSFYTYLIRTAQPLPDGCDVEEAPDKVYRTSLTHALVGH